MRAKVELLGRIAFWYRSYFFNKIDIIDNKIDIIDNKIDMKIIIIE